MTLPNGPAGLAGAIEWPIQFVGGGLQALVGREQAAVTAALQAEVQLSTAWNYATSILYDGLQRGIPFVLSLLQSLVQRLFDTVESFPGVHEVLDAIEQVPAVKQVQGLLSAAVDQFDGTAQAVVSAVINFDGTVQATFNQYVTSPVMAMINNIDGTITGLSELIFHNDGTAIFSAPEQPIHTLNPLVSLFDQFDGTAMSVARVLANASIAAHEVGAAVGGGLTRVMALPQQIIDIVAQAFNALAQAGQSPESLVSTIQNALGGLLPAVIDNLDGTGAALANIVNNADGTATYIGQQAANAIQTVVDNVDGTAMSLAAAMNNAVAGAQQTGANIVNGLAGIWGSIFGALSGAPTPAAATPAQAYTALTQQAQTTNTNTANIGGLTGLTVASVNQALQRSSAGTGTSGGTNVTINFSSYSNQSSLAGIMSQETASLSAGGGINNPIGENLGGTTAPVTGIGISGGVATWSYGTNAPRSGANYDFQLYPTATTSDYQVVSMQLGAANTGGHVLLIGRSNSTMGTCVIGYVGTTYVSSGAAQGVAFLGCYVGGAWNFLQGGNVALVPGGLYELICGDEPTSNLYSIKLICNGSTLVSYNDSGHISQVGSSFRQAGLGMSQITYPTNGGGSVVGTPPNVVAWGVADNAPPSVIGSGFRAYRTSATTVATSTGANLIPGSFFDTTQWITGDLTYASSTNTLTVTVAGWYTVTIAPYVTCSSGGAFGAALYHNGSLAQMGSYLIAGGYNGPWQATFNVYCATGDTLQPGYFRVSGGYSFIAPAFSEPSATFSYWEVALMNCGTLS